MTVMEDCAVARKFRGVHVMHDATECGVWGGLYEMGRAGGYGLRIEEERIPVQPVIRKTAELFRFDPFAAISEGTLIAMVDRKDTEGLVGALNDRGIPAAVAGEVVAAGEGMKIVGPAGQRILEHPKVDPYWILAAEFSK
jgi:hydrogenase expression/formation protein HypE